MPGKVRVIPANTNEPMKHVVIYARVSSNSMEQLDSLKAQISGLTKFVSGHNNWKLVVFVGNQQKIIHAELSYQ